MKVMVGFSGGVDSAIAAYLLKQQGHEVACAFMRNWDASVNNDIMGNPTINDDTCPQEADYHDAQQAAAKLGLELYRIDFIKEYWDDVFSFFLQEYQAGRTPNPDILCNKYIKFDRFLKFAETKGYSHIATGHYAKIGIVDGERCLMRAADLNKDQSYFLCQINKKVLDKVLFPLADITKPEVRKLARELGLAIADKKDSTGICFIGERKFQQFLNNYLPAQTGKIVDIDHNCVIGHHEGVLYYTIGQRKGLRIGGAGGPWFVVGKDVRRNILYVAEQADNSWLISDSCRVVDVNWLSDQRPSECTVKFRYRQKDHPVLLEFDGDHCLIVSYPQGVSSVTPGQEAVFYQGAVCLGGGIIADVYRDHDSLRQRIEGAVHVSI